VLASAPGKYIDTQGHGHGRYQWRPVTLTDDVWGHGHLNYKGARRAFKLSGVSIVDVGASHITASGVVYNLTRLRGFSGNYTTVSAGLTVAGGGSVVVLRNGHGVVIKLVSTAEGLRFNLSADGVNIKLTT
jgi:hypothetical protein